MKPGESDSVRITAALAAILTELRWFAMMCDHPVLPDPAALEIVALWHL